MEREMTRIERWFGVRPDEERDAFAAFAVLFGLMAGHTMLETARDTLFLQRLSANELPGVYLASAGLGLALTILDRKLARRASSVVAIGAFVSIGALVTAGLAFANLEAAPVLYGLYLWSNVFASWAILQFSLVTSSRFDVQQAKRVLGFVGAGAIVGAVFGAALARGVVAMFPPRDLLIAAGALFLITAAGPLAMLAKSEPHHLPEVTTKLRDDAMRGAVTLAKKSYARLLLLLLLSSTIALTIGDFAFKRYAGRSHAHDLAPFFANVQVGVNAIALVVQLSLVPVLLRTLGPHLGLLPLPLLLGAGGVGMLFGNGLFGALMLRGSDGALRYSLHKTSFDLLYFPLTDTERRRVKPVLDVLGQRGGQALAALLLLFLDRATKGPMLVSLLAAITLWIGSVLLLRLPYVRLFRESLARGQVTAMQDLRLDLRALESTVAALSSPREREVIFAIDLLAAHRGGALVPVLGLYHPQREVVLHTLIRLCELGRVDALPAIDGLFAHADPEVRAAAVRARAQLRPDEEVLRKLLADPRPEVAATALVALVAHGWLDREELPAAMAGLQQARAPEVRIAIARAAMAQPSPDLVPALQTCANTDDDAVIEATVAAMALVPDPSYLGMLVPLLTTSRHRETARRALLALGPPALHALDELLGDPDTPHNLRRHLPESIRRFPAAEALAVLVARYPAEKDGMVKFKILRSLNRLRLTDPTLPIPEDMVANELHRTLEQAFRLAHLRAVLQTGDRERPGRRTAAEELLLEVLHDKRMHAAERAVRLVNLLLPREDFRPVMRAFTSDFSHQRASAIEVLGATLPVRYRGAILALLESKNDPIDRAFPFYEPATLTYEQALGELARTSGTVLRALAAYHATELGLPVPTEPIVIPSARPSAQILGELVRQRALAGAHP